jgi:MtrB/PioB family decaheme-associated outer membrane protein
MKAIVTRMAAVAALLCAGWALPAAAEVNQDVSIGAQGEQVYSNGKPQSKFDEYQTHPTGGIFDYTLDYNSGTDYDLNFFIKDLDESLQNFKMDMSGGREGLFTYDAGWVQTPHVYSYDAQTLYSNQGSVAGNYLVLPTGLGGALAPGTATTQRNTLNSLLSTEPFMTLQVQSDKANLDLSYHPAKDMTVKVGASRLHKEGTRAIEARTGFGNVALPVPIDNTAAEGYVNVGLDKKNYQIDFRYDVSSFHNMYQEVDFQAVNVSPAAAGGMYRLSMAPDDLAQSFNLSGGADLPNKTHFAGQVSYSLWTQNQDLEPFTPDATAAANLQNTSSLPNLKAGGAIRVYTQNYRLTNSAIENFRTSLGFRSYDYEDKSDQIFFPNGWVPGTGTNALSTSEGGAAGTATNRYGFRKDDLEWKGDIDLSKTTTLNLGYTNELKHEDREVPITDENMGTAGLMFKPEAGLFINVSYLNGRRRGKGYDANWYLASDLYAENPNTVRYDEADRNRNQGRFQVNYTKDASSYGFSYRITQDSFLPGQIPLDGNGVLANGLLWQFNGVQVNNTQAAGLNLTHELSGTVSMDMHYEYDYSRMILDGSSANPDNSGGNTAWTERLAQTSQIAGVAFDVKPNKDFKATASYDFDSTVNHYDALNGAGFANNDGAGAQYTSNSMQPTLSRTHTFQLKGRYQLTKAIGLTARWMYRKYEINDYMVGALPLVPNSGGALYMGNSQQGYRAQFVSMAADYRF